MYSSIDCDSPRLTYKKLRQHAKEIRQKRKEQLKWCPLWLQIILPLTSILIFPMLVFVPLLFHYKNKYIREINQKITKLSNNEIELSISDFLRMRNQTFGGQWSSQYVKDKQFPGVYILYNKTKNMYYVGQAQYIYSIELMPILLVKETVMFMLITNMEMNLQLKWYLFKRVDMSH